jgi:hypothetical protein
LTRRPQTGGTSFFREVGGSREEKPVREYFPCLELT